MRIEDALRLLARIGLDAARPPAAGASVRVDGIDATTLPLLPHLVEAGIRRFEVVERRAVDDRLAPLLPPGELGAPRRGAASRRLSELARDALVAPLGAPDLVILSRERAHDPAAWGPLMREDLPHLLLTATELGVQVGPVVVPGATACAQCIGLAAADAWPDWPDLALSLPRWEPTALPLRVHHFAAGAAAAMALDFLRRGGAALPGEMWWIRDGGLERFQWQAHPRCGCGAAGAFSSGNPGTRARPPARSRRTGPA